jgi:D-serine dehydratase
MMKSHIRDNPIVAALAARRPVFWINPGLGRAAEILPALDVQYVDILEAEARLCRFAPLISALFAEAAPTHGIIESSLVEADRLKEGVLKTSSGGRLLVKCDHDLPVAGSVKARGGIYEVLCFAEKLALERGLLKYSGNYRRLAAPEAKALFSKYTVSVGSTGNLGMSIGIMGAALGFKAQIHMSADAKAWKKKLLKARGTEVIEYGGDYGAAVEQGRARAREDPYNFFIDDENSVPLFLGYAVAALRLKNQLTEKNIPVDAEHPLIVYLPCGVGGAPGGITFGLKHVFGDHVHCFFAEPVESPCMTLGLATEKHGAISVYDIGLTNRTDADGLAVARPSQFIGKVIAGLVGGCFTVPDEAMYGFVREAWEAKLRLEPSAAAGFSGPDRLFNTPEGANYLQKEGLAGMADRMTHILWTTGGRYVPDNLFKAYLHRPISPAAFSNRPSASSCPDRRSAAFSPSGPLPSSF